MAYGGRCDVTKQVVIYVKEHYYLSNQELDRNIQKLYGCIYADDSDTPNKISGAKIFIAACMGGLGIYGLFHGANPIHNFGGFVIALLLIGGAIACIGGHKK